jgi:hypothetical protein
MIRTFLKSRNLKAAYCTHSFPCRVPGGLHVGSGPEVYLLHGDVVRVDVVASTILAARHAVSFNGMTMDTSDGEGHHVTVVGSAVNASFAVSTTIHGDAHSPMGVASTTVADGSTLSTLQRSSSHDAKSSL